VKVHCAHTSDETHTSIDTHFKRHTPEEMYSESESEENADNENEDQRHCLAVEVDKPEIDDIMRGCLAMKTCSMRCVFMRYNAL